MRLYVTSAEGPASAAACSRVRPVARTEADNGVPSVCCVVTELMPVSHLAALASPQSAERQYCEHIAALLHGPRWVANNGIFNNVCGRLGSQGRLHRCLL